MRNWVLKIVHHCGVWQNGRHIPAYTHLPSTYRYVMRPSLSEKLDILMNCVTLLCLLVTNLFTLVQADHCFSCEVMVWIYFTQCLACIDCILGIKLSFHSIVCQLQHIHLPYDPLCKIMKFTDPYAHTGLV